MVSESIGTELNNPSIMKLVFLSIILSFMSGLGDRETYIDRYKDLAIIEMNRKGIPASIKLAQAILESRSGESQFAAQSKNHFGIKCKDDWRGNMYLHIDDDRDEEGELIESCFRSYDDVINSYVDHSNFLSSKENYAALFALSITDYRGWAQGLQDAGYATDPQYAEKLIKIIEHHGLDAYDRQESIVAN